MTNPFVHALVLITAVVIPGGLLIYFAWMAARRSISFKAKPNQNANSGEIGHTPAKMPIPHEARAAFENMFPKDSLRAQSRQKQLQRARTSRRKNPKK